MDAELLKVTYSTTKKRALTLRLDDDAEEDHVEVTVHMNAKGLPEEPMEAQETLIWLAIDRLHSILKMRARKKGEPSPPAPWHGEY